MCRKVELLDKRMMLGVVVTQIVSQMMQFQQLHQHQIEVDSLSSGNLSSIQPALRHLIDFITVQHQMGCESVIRSDFRKWFPRMCQYGFIEDRDYEYMPRVRLQDEGGRTVQRYVKDYRITQDMAKKLCKLHHTAVGAVYHPQPFDWDALLGLLHKKPPRRSSYEAQLSESNSLVTTTQIAKEYGCGAKVFNRLLHLHGIQYRVNGQWVLYSEHHGKGYTSSLTFRLQRSDGSEVEKLHTAWTQKGRKFLYHTLKRRGVLPLAEQGG